MADMVRLGSIRKHCTVFVRGKRFSCVLAARQRASFGVANSHAQPPHRNAANNASVVSQAAVALLFSLFSLWTFSLTVIAAPNAGVSASVVATLPAGSTGLTWKVSTLQSLQCLVSLIDCNGTVVAIGNGFGLDPDPTVSRPKWNNGDIIWTDVKHGDCAEVDKVTLVDILHHIETLVVCGGVLPADCEKNHDIAGRSTADLTIVGDRYVAEGCSPLLPVKLGKGRPAVCCSSCTVVRRRQ